MRVFLVGVLCALLGIAAGSVADFLVLGTGVSAAGMQAALPLAWGIMALALTLLVGLCIVAPLLPQVRGDGLRTPQGVVLIAVIVALQLFVGLASLGWGGFFFVATVVPGLVATALALAFFDRIAAAKRGAAPMTVVLVGFSCGALVGPIIAAWTANLLFTSVYPQSLPGAYSIGPGAFIGLDALAVAASLLAGLCVIAPLVPGIAADGLRTRRGAILAAAILAGQIGVVLALLPQPFRPGGNPVPYSVPDWLLIVGATALPAVIGTIVALALFDVLVGFLAGTRGPRPNVPEFAAPRPKG